MNFEVFEKAYLGDALSSKRADLSEIDITAIEEAGDALIRSGHTQTAIKLYALSLRLRSETGLHPERRRDDAVT